MFYLPHHYPGGSVTLVETVISEYNLPRPSSIPFLNRTYKDFTTLVWLPWDHMVRTSYSMALEYFRITPVWDIPEALLNNLLPSQDQTYFQQFTDMLTEVINDPPLFTDVFGGLAPFTNAPLQRLASAGSSFFDHIYAQLATILQIQTTAKQNLVAPNDAFVEIYDQVLYSISPSSQVYSHRDQYLGRHWNNKGNSLESLSLLSAEQGFHSFVWVMS